MIWTKKMIEYEKFTGDEPFIVGLDSFEEFLHPYVGWLEGQANTLDMILEKLRHTRGLFKMLIPAVSETEPVVAERAKVIDEYIVELLNGITDEEWASEKL